MAALGDLKKITENVAVFGDPARGLIIWPYLDIPAKELIAWPYLEILTRKLRMSLNLETPQIFLRIWPYLETSREDLKSMFFFSF